MEPNMCSKQGWEAAASLASILLSAQYIQHRV